MRHYGRLVIVVTIQLPLIALVAPRCGDGEPLVAVTETPAPVRSDFGKAEDAPVIHVPEREEGVEGEDTRAVGAHIVVFALFRIREELDVTQAENVVFGRLRGAKEVIEGAAGQGEVVPSDSWVDRVRENMRDYFKRERMDCGGHPEMLGGNDGSTCVESLTR